LAVEMAQVSRNAARDFPKKENKGVEEISDRYKKKNAATPEKMARLRGHLPSLMALR
jgi:hypothetical protein